jgi:hypothetical protein
MSSVPSTIRVFFSHHGKDSPRIFITTLAEEELHDSANSASLDYLTTRKAGAEIVVLTPPEQGHPDQLFFSFGKIHPYSSRPIFDELTLLRKKLWGELRHTRYALSALCVHRRKVREHYEVEHWLRLMADLLRKAQSWKIRFDFHRLVAVLKLAEKDPRVAYDQLTAMFQRELAHRKARIHRSMRAVSTAQAVFCNLSLASYSVRNLISSQRSWFLLHGSHPSPYPSPAYGCF